jgi:hypothetical protein
MVVMFPHLLVWETLRLLGSLALLIFAGITRTLCGPTRQGDHGRGFVKCLETHIELLGPFSNEISSTLGSLAAS